MLERGVQQARVQRLEPIVAPQCLGCAFGYRTGRAPQEALRQVWRELQAGESWLVDAALRASCDTIDQPTLVDLMAAEISDGRVLNLGWRLLRVGGVEAGEWQPTLTGVPPGGGARPLGSNSYLPPFDRYLTQAGFRRTRGADDLVMVGKTRQEAERALALARRFLQADLAVEMPPQNTRIVHINHGVELLGYQVKRGRGSRLPDAKRRRRANPQHLYAVPRPKSVQRLQEQMRARTRRKAPLTLPQGIDQIHPGIRGWGTFYRKAPVRLLCTRLDRWSERRLYAFLAKRWRNGTWRT